MAKRNRKTKVVDVKKAAAHDVETPVVKPPAKNANAFTTGFPIVRAQLPDGAVIHGVTLPSMLSVPQPRHEIPQ